MGHYSEDTVWMEESEPTIVSSPHDMKFRWQRIAPWLGAIVLTSLAGVLLVKMVRTTNPASLPTQSSAPIGAEASANSNIVVDVKGDVVHPGVYTLPDGSRVTDAIRLAGGLLHPNDSENVNLALPLDDGSEVIVPGPVLAKTQAADQRPTGSVARPDSTTTRTGPVVPPSVHASGNVSQNFRAALHSIDLNTANTSTLETIHGIGPKRALAIVNYRTQHGAFQSIDDLRKIRGIGPKLFSQISQFLIIAK